MSDEAVSSLPRRVRRAARILLMDEHDRLLLIRFAPPTRRAFWCGVGGECDPGEDFHAAAVRELFEETGLSVESCGPEIAQRTDDFITLEGEPVTSDERFFRVRTASFTPDPAGHTALERELIKEFRWFAAAELAQWHEPVFPVNILELLQAEVSP
ncbi:NUDIX domain-containing protein [Novosphingobium sp.]|uniref:NUDIX hydrolase n=1 Tax=Novosphingobium sp. TaxID=1874826 RepID=UPI0026360F24|nr:NUDIX domain-containing protein [Novosphingobium sp.]